MRCCRRCGDALPADFPNWKTYHPWCYAEAIDDGEIDPPRSRSNGGNGSSGEAAALKRENDNLRQKIKRFETSSAIAALGEKELLKIISLTHPDKHGGSELSLRVTQFFNTMRDRVKAGK